MGIGVSIFLIAVGAILAFAVNADISGLDIAVVGYILMIVGVIGLIMTAFIWGPRRTAAPRGEVVEERRTYDDRGI
ncbi:MAG: hypothetical protein QOE19_2936 [Actinomycetota bacterium]|jgi:hypothetical protein|nr:hypothetical protein [Actinomycetota bacterium]MDQ1664623.1 hypothetical protein [Actinomycetota bacterium]